MEVCTSKGEAVCPRHVLGRPSQLFNAAQACGLLGERGDIRRAEGWRAFPQIGVIALGVDNAFPTTVGRNELKRNCFIELLLRPFTRREHCKGAAHLVASHE